MKCILAALGPALIPDLGPALIPDLGPAMIPAQIPVLSPAPNTVLALVLHPFLFLALGCFENDLHSALGLVPVPGPGCAGGSTPALHPALTPAPVLGHGPSWLCPCLGPHALLLPLYSTLLCDSPWPLDLHLPCPAWPCSVCPPTNTQPLLPYK